MTYFINTIDYKRECGSCSECCSGALSGQIYEYTMHRNNPCHFAIPGKSSGCCNIYEHRPDMCSQYECLWLTQAVAIPEWMKPELSKVIITKRNIEYKVDEDIREESFYQVTECFGHSIRNDVLNWVLLTMPQFNENLEWQVNGQYYRKGSEHFLKARTEQDSN